MLYELRRAVHSLTGPDVHARLSDHLSLKNLSDLRLALGYLGLALHRDVQKLQVELASNRSERRKLEDDMGYAKRVNAELGQRNSILTERNDSLEVRNRKLEARNHNLEERNPYLESENARLKKQNQWLYYGTKCKEPGIHSGLLERLSAARDAPITLPS